MAKQLIIVDLDFNGNHIENVIAESLSAAPVTGVAAGRYFYNSTTGCLSYYNGTEWVDLKARVTASSMADDNANTKVFKILDGSSTSGNFAFRALKAGTGIAITNTSGVLELALDDLNVTDTEVDGQFVTVVSEVNGKISVSRKAVAADKVTLSSTKDLFNGKTNVKAALEEIADWITDNELSAGDTTLDISAKTGEGATGKEIKTKISANDNHLTKESDGLKVNIGVSKITTGLSAGVKEAYKVTDKSGNQVGDLIQIYNDTSLHNFYLGHVDDVLRDADAQGESTTDVVTSGTGATALVWIMQLNNLKYKLAAVDVSSFLEESEFEDGLEVTNHVVKVKVDSTSGKVRIAADTYYTAEDPEVIAGTKNVGDVKVSGLVSVISVSSSGVKVYYIQDAITYAVNTAKATIDNYTVNGKKISVNPILDGTDINLSNSYTKATHAATADPADVDPGDSIETAIGKLEDKADTNSDRIDALEGSHVRAYNTSATSGTSITVTATTHKCGTVPAVKVYYEGYEVMAQVAIDSSGNVTVSWNNNLTVSAEHPVVVKIIG
jgi:hypothetical protein